MIYLLLLFFYLVFCVALFVLYSESRARWDEKHQTERWLRRIEREANAEFERIAA